jgi:hypothetical protein
MPYYYYDEEALYQDADVEMAEAREVGAAIARQRAKGVCCHLSAVGYLAKPVYETQIGLKPGQLRCTDGCGQVFADDDDYYAAMRYALPDY